MGCAAMRAALAARNQDLLRQTLLRAEERYEFAQSIRFHPSYCFFRSFHSALQEQ